MSIITTMEEITSIKGRGAQFNPVNPFDPGRHLKDPLTDPEENIKTRYLEIEAKTIVNPVPSEDVGMEWSMNPYQGCEHGCIYCYARGSHQYWGYSGGLEFETNIQVKMNTAELLLRHLSKKSWEAAPIVMSGNTDCYQPAEAKYKITRACLEIFRDLRHPVGIITKNSMILRDLDILKKLAKDNLVHVNVSFTTLDESLRQVMEPRTASSRKRLEVIQVLSDNGIPVRAMIAPIIPGLTDSEILPMIKAVADAGARAISHIIVRLNGVVEPIFIDWVERKYPDRAERILNRIRDCHGGQLHNYISGKRMKGEGNVSEMIAQQVALGRKLYLQDREIPPYNLDLFKDNRPGQLSLF